MAEISAPYRVLDPAQAERMFAVSADVGYPYREFAAEREIRVYEGGLAVVGDLHAPPEPGRADWHPYNVVVAGDLTVAGDLAWSCHGGGCFLLVTGDLRARNGTANQPGYSSNSPATPASSSSAATAAEASTPCRGRGGFEDLKLGAVTQQVLEHASVPVLVARRG